MSDAPNDPPPEPTGYTVDRLETLVARGDTFACILADPPWRHDRRPRGAAEHHYHTMSADEIAALPVARLAAANAHLHLWTTHSFLFEARRVLEQWGFSYKGVFVWVKPQMGTGHYWRSAAEFLLLGVKGNLTFRDRSIPNWACLDRHEHSHKPERVRTFIERVSPGPYLELFGRRAVHGWVVFGDEISRGLFDNEVLELEDDTPHTEPFAPAFVAEGESDGDAVSAALCLVPPAQAVRSPVPADETFATSVDQFRRVVDLLTAIGEHPPTKPDPPKYLTAEDAAAYCRVALQTIYNNRRHIARMPGVRKLLFTREALDTWLATRPSRRRSKK